MNVTEAIHKRRAYRSLVSCDITEDLIDDLARHASLSPSCFNNQPWRFVFCYDEDVLNKLYPAVSSGNKWVQLASMIIAVFSRAQDDCQIRERIYHQFDTGMATAFLILRATELELVAHPIAGFNESLVKEVLRIPDDYQVITLVNVGARSDDVHPFLSEKQVRWEMKRPKRLSLNEFVFHNGYTGLER